MTEILKKEEQKLQRENTLEEVGKEFQVTRERIRQIEARALRRLRLRKDTKVLRSYLSE